MAAKRLKQNPTNSDLYAEVDQSASDKLLNSVGYPFTAFEKKQDFPGCSKQAQQGSGAFYQYSEAEITAMLKKAAQYAKKRLKRDAVTVEDQVYAFAGSIIEQAKKVLDIPAETYVGPRKELFQAIVDGGMEKLPETLKPFGDFGIYAWCPYLRVIIRKRPSLTLSSPRIDLSQVEISVTATGELWAKYPWWNCYKWCTHWEKVLKCDRIGSATLTVDLKAALHANIEAAGHLVYARGEFDKLRLDYPILDKLPLEGIANSALHDKLVYVLDAGQFAATVPVLKSRFSVATVQIPNNPSGIGVGITLKQI